QLSTVCDGPLLGVSNRCSKTCVVPWGTANVSLCSMSICMSVEVIAFRKRLGHPVVSGDEFIEEFVQSLGENGFHAGVFHHGQQAVRRLVAALLAAIDLAQAVQVLLHEIGAIDQASRHF